MTRCLPSILAVLALAATAACDEQARSDRRTAASVVLEGTISDEMLPLDTISSRAPPASGESDAGGAKPARSDETPSKPAIPEDQPPVAPAAEPAPPAEAPKPGFGE